MILRYRRMIKGLKKKQKKIRRGRPSQDPWHLYILKCGDGSLYTGISNNVERRVENHQSGKGARFTRTRLPVALVYRESCVSRSAALIREYAVKAFSRQKKERLIAGETVSKKLKRSGRKGKR